MRVSKHTRLIGVDLGGTNVRAGLVHNGRITALEARPHSAKASAEEIIDQICQTIAKVLRPDVSGIGVGVPTVVSKGIVYSPNNIPSWKVVPLQQILEDRFHLPVVLNNDAKCFALGELHFGAGRGYKNLVGLIVGTGLGAGVVINGKLYSGSNSGAGEIGSIAYKGKDFEYYCSGRFFQREFGLDGATLYARAENGDRKAQEMFAAFGDNFADVIMALLYAYDPEVIVLGGSVVKAYPYYEARMRERLKTFHFQNSVKHLKIVRNKKENIAVVAAASLCLDSR